MGFPYNTLVPPAILFMNPGVTREEFVELLDQTHSSSLHTYKAEDSWDYWNENTHDLLYHQGLKGLARLLFIKKSEDWEKFDTSIKDENGLWIHPPLMFPAREGEDYIAEVIIHEKNVIGNPKTVKELSWYKLEVGDIWEEAQMGFERGLVTKIFEEEFLGGNDEDDWGSSGPEYDYKMEIREISKEGKEEKFQTLDELYKKWPQFHPNFVYDWSQNEGHFPSGSFSGDKFLWKQIDGRYYLDKRSFDQIPASIRSGSYGFTDLVLTAEAIKNKAWKILSYQGLKHFPQFLRDFPEARIKYERAIWDSQTSIYAKMKSLTINEFLRTRLIGLNKN